MWDVQECIIINNSSLSCHRFSTLNIPSELYCFEQAIDLTGLLCLQTCWIFHAFPSCLFSLISLKIITAIFLSCTWIWMSISHIAFTSIVMLTGLYILPRQFINPFVLICLWNDKTVELYSIWKVTCKLFVSKDNFCLLWVFFSYNW